MPARVAFSMWWIACLLLCAHAGRAQPIRGRILEGFSIERAGEGRRIRIRFAAPVRYLRHAPLSLGEALQVEVARLEGAVGGDPLEARESLLVPRDTPVPLREVSFEGAPGLRGILRIQFSREVDFRVLPGDDRHSILVELPELRAGRAAPPAKDAPAEASGRAALLVRQGREAMTAGELERAVQIFTAVLALPESPSSREARELLGLARERKGQLAHAVAEYRAYLERYPDGEDAERVRQRLTTLLTARAGPVERIREPTPESRPVDFRTFGSLYTSYRAESHFTDELGETRTDSSLLTDAFVASQLRSEAYTLRSEFSGGYRRDFLRGGSDEYRVSNLFLEARAHRRHLFGSLGRRSRSSGGVLGRYDGVRLGYRLHERWELSGVAGLPVESPSSFHFGADKLFAGMALDVAKIAESLDAQIFAIHQIADGTTDRSAVGGEFRYFRDGRFAAGLVDYDVYFQSLNIAQLVANWRITPTLFLNALADYRNVPSISTSNALSGQVADDLSELRDLFSNGEIKSLAEDRTAKSLMLSLGASRNLRPDLQLAFDFATTKLDGTDDSGGVEGIEGTGFEFSYFGQLIANDLLRQRDVGVLGLRFFDGSARDAASVRLDYRFPVNAALRLNPRLAGELRLDANAPDSFELKPSLRFDWRIASFLLDAEAGVAWRTLATSLRLDDDWGYYATAGLRYDF